MNPAKPWRDASGRLTFDFSDVGWQDYPALCKAIADAFGLAPVGAPLAGPDQVFGDFRREDQVVGLDWDVWMEFMVAARTENSEPLVREIAERLPSLFAGIAEGVRD